MFTDVAECHAPTKRTRIKGCHVPWMTSELKASMQERDRCFRKAAKSNPPCDWSKYKSLKSHVNSQVKKSKSDFYLNLIEKSKNEPNVISTSLTKIYNRSLATSIFPTVWKCGKVTALFKSGDRCNANNYRPITILPTASKILERTVHSQVHNYLLQGNILTPKQFGFRPKLSTAIALTYFTDAILDNLDKGSIAGAVFLGLSKAFASDTVSHDRLIKKLSTIGFSQETIHWFTCYLSNRTQVTFVGLEKSTTKPVQVGVPQGSILNPLLFLIYVNDLPSTVNICDITLYADDTVLFCSAKSAIELEQKLNSDLLNLSHWFAANRLTLNTSKCKFMVFASNAQLTRLNDVSLLIDNCPLSRAESFKYLGIA